MSAMIFVSGERCPGVPPDRPRRPVYDHALMTATVQALEMDVAT
jgi:hypothetical protein